VSASPTIVRSTYLIRYFCGGKYVGFKQQLQSLKRELKGWEAMFERKHGHKPTKVCLAWSYDSVVNVYPCTHNII
jgi:hypothetical protein